jgi:tetratricopeptide (TPR) repeat protein
VVSGQPPLPARPRIELLLDALAVVGLLVLLVLPLAAVASASSSPGPAGPAVDLPPLQRDPAGAALRSVPVFTATGITQAEVSDGAVFADQAAMAVALERQTRAVFGPAGDGGLSAYLRATTPGTGLSASEQALHYPAVDLILGPTLGPGAVPSEKAADVNDLAGLLVLAAVEFPEQFPNAVHVAYGLYDRARQGGACDAQLNLAFLVTTDPSVSSAVDTELLRAAEACPGDPTPLWLLGQLRSVEQFRPVAQDDASTPFTQLQERFPGSASGWSGEADALVRRAYRSEGDQPFSARRDFRRALALYQRAEQLDDDPGLAAGEARAAAGMGDYAGAAAAQRRALDRVPDSAAVQVRLVDYLERDHRFGEAADVNVALLGSGVSWPHGPALIARRDAGYLATADGAAREDALGPVSIGTGRLLPVSLNLGYGQLPRTDGVTDISFIPPFRPVDGLTGSQGSCRERSYRRDLVLAGRAPEALGDPPGVFASTRPASGKPFNVVTEVVGECPDSTRLDAMARFESGDLDGALRSLSTPGEQQQSIYDDVFGASVSPRAALLDLDQNLWRYAGDLDKAATVAEQWAQSERADPRGPDRAGEIAFLRQDYPRAATYFAEAVARAKGKAVGHEQVKQGTALELGGDLAGARAVLSSADLAAGASVSPYGGVDQALLDSYNARLQAGDTELRAHDYVAAEDHYRAARERQAQMTKPEPSGFSAAILAQGLLAARREPLFRPEVLENNEAIVLLELGRHDEALVAATAAVTADPANPVFLANQAAVHEMAGDLPAAADGYRAALAADPTAFPSANNLGVILADEGHLSEAAEQFRVALAADDSYATAHFNLGLVLDRMGPTHFVEAQGELADASRLEPELREHDHDLIADQETFFTTLDLSKPLPPTWHFASSERRTPAIAAGAVLAVLLARLLWAFAQDHMQGSAVESGLETAKRRLSSPWSGAGKRVPGVVAMALVAAVFVYPLTRSSKTTTADTMVLALGVSIMALAFMRVRSVVAHRGAVPVKHYPCVPAVLVGGVAAVFGVGFAPMPATDGAGALPRHARWISTGLLGALGLTLLILGRLSLVPFSTQLGAIALVMTASALVPIEPYDGALLDEGHTGLLITGVLAGIAILLELGFL